MPSTALHRQAPQCGRDLRLPTKLCSHWTVAPPAIAQPHAGSTARQRLSQRRSVRLAALTGVQASQSQQSLPTHTPSPAEMFQALSLESIRSSLIRQEDTIIFNFIERAQFCRNAAVYTPEAIPVPGFDRQGKRYSLLQYVLRETEQLHAKLRRYTAPEEHAFFPDDLPPLVLPPISYPAILWPAAESVNINKDVMRVYLEEVLPGITPEGDDNQYGSSSILDILCLQALSKRIHYGKFVAEAKFREKPEQYSALIKARDAQGILDLLTDKAVEKKVLERVRLKAATFGQDIAAPGSPTNSTHNLQSQQNGLVPKLKISPDVVASVYEKWVMPLTKEVEVQYLLKRLES